jgi:hypothetical protein
MESSSVQELTLAALPTSVQRLIWFIDTRIRQRICMSF